MHTANCAAEIEWCLGQLVVSQKVYYAMSVLLVAVPHSRQILTSVLELFDFAGMRCQVLFVQQQTHVLAGPSVAVRVKCSSTTDFVMSVACKCPLRFNNSKSVLVSAITGCGTVGEFQFVQGCAVSYKCLNQCI